MSPNTVFDAYFAPFYNEEKSVWPCQLTTQATPSIKAHELLSIAPQPAENSSNDAVDAIRRAAFAMINENPCERFIPEEECTQNGMESKAILEQLSILMYEDRHEVERQLRSSLPSKLTNSPFDRVAKWIVCNELERTESEAESFYDAAIFKFEIFKGWVEEDDKESESETSY